MSPDAHFAYELLQQCLKLFTVLPQHVCKLENGVFLGTLRRRGRGVGGLAL